MAKSNTKPAPKPRKAKKSTTVNTMAWEVQSPPKKYRDACKKLKDGRNG